MIIRKEYSERIISKIREKLENIDLLLQHNVSVVVTGSFGRNEASDISDMDWFIISQSILPEDTSKEIKEQVTTIVNTLVKKNVGSTGTFGGVITQNELLHNFCGSNETNQELTRRMLYLLESTWLFNEVLFKSTKNDILNTYIKSDISDSGLNRFMLNDVIRYYRTICTDYEYKTTQDGKEWGVRKIKLRFSRKLLYFSGLITVASTCNYTRDDKIEKTSELLNLSPIDRIQKIIGNTETTRMMDYYAEFLKKISTDSIRNSLDSVKRENRHENSDYRYLKNLSQHFNWEMEKCFFDEFPSSHPIHAAMIF